MGRLSMGTGKLISLSSLAIGGRRRRLNQQSPGSLQHSDRVAPPQTREAGEVAVVRVDFTLVLHRQSRDMRVRNEIPTDPSGFQISAEKVEVPRAGVDSSDVRGLKPSVHGINRHGWRNRKGYGSGIGHDSRDMRREASSYPVRSLPQHTREVLMVELV